MPPTHIYFVCSSPVRFSTLKNLFGDAAHIERCRGSNAQNIDYIFKRGRWNTDPKHSSIVEGSAEEYGTLPQEATGFSLEAEIVSRIQDGATNAEIVMEFPQYLRGLRDIDYVRQTLRAEEYSNKWRDVTTCYIFGNTALGKTRYVMETFGYENVYKICSYKNCFDGYQGQPVIAFDEFDSSLKIQDMNNYLDGYPLKLPARYSDKQACYETVFIISNLDLREQYKYEQQFEPAVWAAFLRRIKKVVHFLPDGTREEYDTVEYMDNPFL